MLQLKDIHTRLRSWDGGMLQTPLLALPALLLPGSPHCPPKLLQRSEAGEAQGPLQWLPQLRIIKSFGLEKTFQIIQSNR